MKLNGLNINVGKLDFNDPESVASAFAAIAQALMESDDRSARRFGQFMKNESVGFVAALADSQRHDWTTGEFMGAMLNAYATTFALVIGAACGPNEKLLGETVKGTTLAFAEMVCASLQANVGNVEPCEADKESATVH